MCGILGIIPLEKLGNREFAPTCGFTTYHPVDWAIIPKTQVIKIPHKIAPLTLKWLRTAIAKNPNNAKMT